MAEEAERALSYIGIAKKAGRLVSGTQAVTDALRRGIVRPVFAAAARLEQAVDKLEEEALDRGEFLDQNVMEEVLGELRDIAARGGISCTCGSQRWTFKVNYSSIDLLCRECGAEMRIPAATADDIDDICCKTKILIRGKGKD